MRSHFAWYVLILAAWACVILASASASSLAPQSSLQSAQPVDATQREVAEAEQRIANAEQQIAFFTKVLAGAAILQLLVTAAYAFFAWGQLAGIRKQAKLTEDIVEANRRSVESAERALVLAQRPKVIVRQFIVKPQDYQASLISERFFDPGQPIHLQFTAANIGGTYADIVDSDCHVHIGRESVMFESPLPMRPSYPKPRGPIVGKLEPGESRPSADIQEPADAADVAAVNEYRAKLFVMGFIKYVDGLQITRTTAFCREWDPRAHRFVPVDNPDFEYAD